ncbi:hypothetical protein P3339_09865 [Microbulbifer sp. MLAF003]|uniref:hypothetical protein n=1 Tax=Microbulbifer sp. MLAF003 TaxID=3032582 RepID=UPI0024ACDC1E|nr:hypothetical protein [Microbulbifer sp. MLAF003]WHI53039.1 hypothetical protein P3339_09865 [Microbulbifer sp. MLAF003]
MSQWLPVIIIGFAIALVLGPVMWLKPNQRDSRLADLRGRAAQKGITVQIQALPPRLIKALLRFITTGGMTARGCKLVGPSSASGWSMS